MNQENPSQRILGNKPVFELREFPYAEDVRREMDALNDRLAALEKRQNDFECGVGFKLSQTKTEKQALASCTHSNALSANHCHKCGLHICNCTWCQMQASKPAPAKGRLKEILTDYKFAHDESRGGGIWAHNNRTYDWDAMAKAAVDEFECIIDNACDGIRPKLGMELINEIKNIVRKELI